jgi:hypothetical protein
MTCRTNEETTNRMALPRSIAILAMLGVARTFLIALANALSFSDAIAPAVTPAPNC